jgi:hypothetical protein
VAGGQAEVAMGTHTGNASAMPMGTPG